LEGKSTTLIKPLAAIALVVAATFVATGPATAQLDPNGTGNCRVGGTVSLRDGRVGTVSRAQGNSCYVRLADGTERYALQWMLTPVSGAGGGVVPGTYQCYGYEAGNMRVNLSGPRYGDAYAVPLPDGRVGLSNRPDGPFYMTCERQGG
jgi:hypothetical protein